MRLQLCPVASPALPRYVWKMCYMWMLGYEIDFGHNEVIGLMSSLKVSEKTVGYLAMSMLIHSNDELMATLVNAVRNDLTTGKVHVRPSP